MTYYHSYIYDKCEYFANNFMNYNYNAIYILKMLLNLNYLLILETNILENLKLVQLIINKTY